jgi:hypothetical protein
MESPSVDSPRRRTWLRPILIILVVFFLLIGVAVWYLNYRMRIFFHDIFAGKCGPVTSTEDWPRPLKELVQDAEHDKITIENLKVHCMCKGYETEYVWRIQSTSGMFEFLKTRWSLSPIPTPDYGIFCGKSMNSGDETPKWWSPKKNPTTKFYVSSRCKAREYGDQFQAAVDDERKMIFIHYYEKW